MKRFVLHAPHVSLPTLLAYAEDASKQNGRRCCAGRAAARRCCPFARVPGAQLCVLQLSSLPLACAGATVDTCHRTRVQEEVKGLQDQIHVLGVLGNTYHAHAAMPTMHTLVKAVRDWRQAKQCNASLE